MPSHYLNQCWNIINSNLRYKFQSNLRRNSNVFILENVSENVIWDMAVILSRLNVLTDDIWKHCRNWCYRSKNVLKHYVCSLKVGTSKNILFGIMDIRQDVFIRVCINKIHTERVDRPAILWSRALKYQCSWLTSPTRNIPSVIPLHSPLNRLIWKFRPNIKVKSYQNHIMISKYLLRLNQNFETQWNMIL